MREVPERTRDNGTFRSSARRSSSDTNQSDGQRPNGTCPARSDADPSNATVLYLCQLPMAFNLIPFKW
jgi:hypothetical protein